MLLASSRAFSPRFGRDGSLHSSSISTVGSSSKNADSVTERMRDEAELEMQKVLQYFEKSNIQKKPILWTCKDDVVSFVDQHIDTVLFDCDGVVYRSPHAAPGATECIQNLLAKGKRVFFVTNNAASNRQQLKEKLCKILSMDNLTEEMMISASYSVAQYLKQELLDVKGSARLFVIGSEGLCEELRQTGFEVCGGPMIGSQASMSRDELAEYDFPEHPIDAVVVGHDLHFTFRKLCVANVLLQMNPNAPLIATNEDSYDLVGVNGRHIPGNGCVVKALEYSSGRKAICTGKPSPTLANLIASEHCIDPSRTLMVGDRLETDIRFGIDTGMSAVLVLTGVTLTDQLVSLGDGVPPETAPMPTMIVPHVGYLS